jgi:hypothetical protein
VARLDTGWHANTKVLRSGAVGMALHAWSISYSDHTLSDGFIPNKAWPSFLERGVKPLIDLHLWEREEGGYRLHDYANYNRTRAQVDAYMAAKAAAGRRGGLARAQASATANGKHELKQALKQNPTPGPGPGPGLITPTLAAAAAAPETG